MRRFPELVAYVATFGSMTAAAAVVIALIVLNAGDYDPQGDGGNGVHAVVSAQDIPAGTEISEQMVKVIDVPQDQLVTGAFIDTQPVIGEVTSIPIVAGEQITASKLHGSSSYGGGVTVKLGKRVVGLVIEPVTTEGERVSAGDCVDILVKQDFVVSGTTVTETSSIENVEVLSVNSESMVPPPLGERGSQETMVVSVGPGEAKLLAQTPGNLAKIRLSLTDARACRA